MIENGFEKALTNGVVSFFDLVILDFYKIISYSYLKSMEFGEIFEEVLKNGKAEMKISEKFLDDFKNIELTIEQVRVHSVIKKYQELIKNMT